jgi:hypothetical protein
LKKLCETAEYVNDEQASLLVGVLFIHHQHISTAAARQMEYVWNDNMEDDPFAVE